MLNGGGRKDVCVVGGVGFEFRVILNGVIRWV